MAAPTIHVHIYLLVRLFVLVVQVLTYGFYGRKDRAIFGWTDIVFASAMVLSCLVRQHDVVAHHQYAKLCAQPVSK